MDEEEPVVSDGGSSLPDMLFLLLVLPIQALTYSLFLLSIYMMPVTMVSEYVGKYI